MPNTISLEIRDKDPHAYIEALIDAFDEVYGRLKSAGLLDRGKDSELILTLLEFRVDLSRQHPKVDSMLAEVRAVSQLLLASLEKVEAKESG